MRLGERRPWTLADLQMFDDYTIVRMWMEGGQTLPMHLRGLCRAEGSFFDCPHCKEEL